MTVICSVAPADYHDVLSRFPSLFDQNFKSPINKHGIQHYIETSGPPVYSGPRRLDAAKLEAAKKEFAELERLGIIRRSSSPWSSPLHVVPKVNGKLRPCGDYLRLNDITIDDKYPLPHLQDFNRHLEGATIFSKIDLQPGYHQVPVNPEHIPKTAICTPFGLFEYLRMPFSLKNAAQAFQRMMDRILAGLSYVFVYLDDILVASKTPEDHHRHLEEVCEILAANGLIVNAEKCELGVRELDFLGHRVTTEGIKPMPDRVESIRVFPLPEDKPGLQRFIGMVNFYHRFMPTIAKILIPLHKAIGECKTKKEKIAWNDERRRAFEKAKDALAEATLLHHPSADAEMTLTVDASDTAMGGQIEQKLGNRFVPIAFFSKKLSPAERKYSAFDRELLAIYSSIIHFKHYVEGRHFTIWTDHKPLTFAMGSMAERSPRQTRHLSFIAEFSTDIRHIKGIRNEVADALSRVCAIEAVDYEELAKEQASCPELKAWASDKSVTLDVMPVDLNGHKVLCDISTGRSRPLVPLSMRRKIFDLHHQLSHPGPRPTQRAILRSYVWKCLKTDIVMWCRECEDCQKSKVSTHVKSEWQKRELPDRRFQSVHIDLVGPLPVCEGYRYFFTCIDRFTRWAEAIPLEEMTAKSCARAFIRQWVSRYGMPEDVTTDRGRQFTSEIWKEMNRLLGVRAATTTAYHPQANGLVERLHRQIKGAIMARQATSCSWMDDLPIVMLGIRTAWRTELDKAPCELVFGAPLSVPGSFFSNKVDREALPSTEFVQGLERIMVELAPTQMAHHATSKPHVPAALDMTDHVFVRTDAVRPPLVRPYTGPYRVLSRSAKYFTIMKNGKPDNITVDRLKPAFARKTGDVIPRAGSSNEKYGVREPVDPGQRRARGRPKKGMTRDVITSTGGSEDDTEGTNPVVPGPKRARGRPKKTDMERLRDSSETESETTSTVIEQEVKTRSGRLSRRPRRLDLGTLGLVLGG